MLPPPHICIWCGCRYIANGVDVLGTVLAVVLGLLYMLYQTLRTFVVFIVPRSPASADATKKRQ
jgi:hypothetical protein